METMAKEMGRVGLNNHDHDHHRRSTDVENGHDHHHDAKEQQGGKMYNNNGKRNNEKTMLRTPADIYEYSSFYSFILDMPGLDAQNIKVKVENGILHVTGKKKKQQQTGAAENGDEEVIRVIRIERRRARYMRKFSLPADATHEDVKATYKDGVLSITVAKKNSLEKSTPNSYTNVSVS